MKPIKFADLARKAYRSINAVQLGGVITPAQLDVAFEAANDMLDAWAAQRLTIVHVQSRTYPLTAGKGGKSSPYTIGPGGNFDQPRPLWIPNAEVLVLSSVPNYEYPLHILNDDAWARTSIKELRSSLPSDLYYDYRFPTTGTDVGLGQIYLYPVPDGSQPIQLVLYTPLQLTEFADRADTDYTFPPGYAEALRYQLALRLAVEFGYPAPDTLQQMAATTFGTIKRPNARAPLLKGETGLRQNGYSGLYNWRTGTFGRREG